MATLPENFECFDVHSVASETPKQCSYSEDTVPEDQSLFLAIVSFGESIVSWGEGSHAPSSSTIIPFAFGTDMYPVHKLPMPLEYM